MLEREWLLETPFGEEVRLGLADAEDVAPDDVDLGPLEDLIAELLLDLDDAGRRRDLEHVFVALTGRPPGNGEYSPFEPSGELYYQDLRQTLASAAASGQLRVARVERPVVSIRQEFDAPVSPLGPGASSPAAPAPSPTSGAREETTTWFEVRFVDHVGDPIDGLDVVFRAGGKEETLTTDGDGVARLEGATSSFGSARVASTQALGDVVEPRFAEGNPLRLPEEPFFRMPFSGELPAVSVESETRRLVVVTPRLDKLFAELWDKTGRVAHADRSYRIEGPVSFSGTTDDRGRLLHEDVPPGDYTLTLTLDEGREATSPLVVLDAGDASPQIRLLGAVPRCVMARLRGLLFDTNKTFILNEAIPSFRRIRNLYRDNNPSELLIVGHCDTTGEPSINDPLSLARAESVAQFLNDDVDAWLENYSQNKPATSRWGSREDLQMIQSMPGFSDKGPDVDAVEWYQAQHNLKAPNRRKPKDHLEVDGICGPETRAQLVYDYMQLDGVTLRDNVDYDITITTHGCGENFPLDDSGERLDQAPADRKADQLDRRAELFFFDRDFGIQPPPPGKNSFAGSTAYPAWRDSAEVVDDAVLSGDVVHRVRLLNVDLEPAPANTVCKIQAGGVTFATTLDDDGVATFGVPRSVTTCVARWDLPGPEGARQRVVRDDIQLLPADDAIPERLANLGYRQATVEEQVLAYQLELGRAETGLLADIADEVKLWHDGGKKPAHGRIASDAAPALAKQGDKKVTAAPKLRVEKFRQRGADAPAVEYKLDRTRSVWRMDVLPGMHTAITFANAGGIEIRSNNPNAVPMDSEIFLDPSQSSNRRTIFFYAKRFPPNDPETTLFEHVEGGKIVRTLLQVRVRGYGRNHAFMRLFGKTVSVNSTDLSPYRMDRNLRISNRTDDPATHPNEPTTPEQVIRLIEGAIQQLGAPIDHLVVQSHGGPGEGDGGFIRLGHDFEHFRSNPRPRGGERFNVGFARHNLHVWSRLAGKVRFIWFQSCAVGSDNALCFGIAQNTGAMVTAPGFFTGLMPPGLGKNGIEYLHDNQTKHFDPRRPDRPISAEDFFRSARRTNAGNLDRALDFNIVRLGPPFPRRG